MGALNDLAEDLRDTAFGEEDFGIPVVYTPKGGTAKNIMAIFIDGIDLDGAQRQAALQASGTLSVLRSDIPVWLQGDVVEIAGVTWSVVRKLGSTSAYWKLAIRTDLRPTFRER